MNAPPADLEIVITDVDGKLIVSDGRTSVAFTGEDAERFRAQMNRFYTPASRCTAFLAGFLFAAAVDFKRTRAIAEPAS